MIDTMTKYDFYIAPEAIEKNVTRLTNQMWKLIPMKENNVDYYGGYANERFCF